MKQIGVEGVKLTEYEMNIASHLVDPRSMRVREIYKVGQFFFKLYFCDLEERSHFAHCL